MKVLDKPLPPRQLVACETDNEVKLDWKAPECDGGSPITGYVIEKRDSTKRTWTAAGRTEQLFCRVEGLVLGTSYFFRVFAQNSCGMSESAETDLPLITKKKCEPPSQPLPPLVKNQVHDACDLTWQPPVTDGGAPLTGYYVEKRVADAPNSRWLRVTKELLEEPSLHVRDLLPDSLMEFRVAAENQAGLLSEFSMPSKRSRAKNPFDVPGIPEKPTVKRTTESTADVQWVTPLTDGGSPITGYVLEYKVIHRL